MFIKEYNVSIRVIYGESFSPFEVGFTCELGPQDNPEDGKKLIKAESDRLINFALQQARTIHDAVAVEKASAPASPTVQVDYKPAFNLGGLSDDALLDKDIPANLFGKTKPSNFKKFGYSFRACSSKEVNFLANVSKKAKSTEIGAYAREILKRNLIEE